MQKKNTLPAVDAYVARAKPFAQPILQHLRELVHQAVPDVQEAIKWQMPFFLKDGIFLANMAAFKGHCAFGFWGEEARKGLKEEGKYSRDAMGVLGRIRCLEELPKDNDLLTYIRAGAAAIAEGQRTRSYSRASKSPKPAAAIPPDLAAALKRNKAAQQAFDAFAPGHRREYIEWITEAKREETRAKRLAQAIEWIAEGQHRNWKYE